LSISLGFAAHADDEDLTIHELEKKADKEMYAAKAGYYEKSGIDRRLS
jgi:GGDEF domain-containing protein